jgi:FlaA1/EpsC-like NDP-sugar epimerase
MQGNGNSRVLFVIDLSAIYTFFFFVFAHYRGDPSIPFEGALLMGLIGFSWFFISISFNICKVNRRSKLIEIIKNVFVAYSVLSAIVIGVVAIYGDFRHNDKLILYPFLYAFIFSTVLRFFYLIIIKHFIKNGYQQKTVLLIGGGHLAQKVIQMIVKNPEFGFRLHGQTS